MGVLLQEARHRAGLTQLELAGAAGISIGALRDLEQGRTCRPRWAAVEELAAVLGLDQRKRAELMLACRAPRVAAAQADLRLSVLGRLTATYNGEILALGSARQRAVLGLLALHPSTGVRPAAIADMLWGERPPASAATEVQGYISRLRRLLDPRRQPRGVIALAGSCYLLSGGVHLDLEDFRRTCRRAQDAAAAGEAARACALFEQALNLWQGDILADVDCLRSHPAIVEADCSRGEAVVSFARGALACRAGHRVLPHLRALCIREPFNEQAHGHLMEALAATGQRVAALEVFGKIARRLDAELGIGPSPQLAATRRRIRQD